MLVMQWGQFLDHDITSTPQTRGFNNSLIRCCGPNGNFLDNDLLHPDCMPIQISSRDLFYSRHNSTCMEFVRSSPAPRRDCTLGKNFFVPYIYSHLHTIFSKQVQETKSIKLPVLLTRRKFTEARKKNKRHYDWEGAEN